MDLWPERRHDRYTPPILLAVQHLKALKVPNFFAGVRQGRPAGVRLKAAAILVNLMRLASAHG